MAETEPTWIYHPTEPAKIVDIERGAKAPKGWSFDPSVIEDEAARTADAVSGVKPFAVFGEDITRRPPGVEPDPAEEVEALRNRVLELETVIQGGTSENERLQAEISGREDELDGLAGEIVDLKQQLAAAAETETRQAAQIAELAEAVRAEGAKMQPAVEEITRLENENTRLSALVDRLQRRRSEG